MGPRMILDNEIKKLIEQRIEEIEKEYQQTQGLILTEDDLKCQICMELNQIPNLSKPERTNNAQNVYAANVHTEISWYDLNDKLAIKPDITILNPENLSILPSDKLKLPSKGCSFSGDAIIFELKFIRGQNGITQRTIASIEKDVKKIQGLFERLRALGATNKIFCYFVVFNKTDKKKHNFDSFIEEHRNNDKYKIIYGTGKVVFPKQQKNV